MRERDWYLNFRYIRSLEIQNHWQSSAMYSCKVAQTEPTARKTPKLKRIQYLHVPIELTFSSVKREAKTQRCLRVHIPSLILGFPLYRLTYWRRFFGVCDCTPPCVDHSESLWVFAVCREVGPEYSCRVALLLGVSN